jgi:uncharacterized protein YgiM (DUF1202 family)
MLVVLSAACSSSEESHPTKRPELTESATDVVPTDTPSQLEPEREVSTTWFVVGDQANIHACASVDCAVLTTASFGKRLAVLETVDGWHRIRLPADEHGWIAADLTSQTSVCKSCQ